jgi:hypothetical protein
VITIDKAALRTASNEYMGGKLRDILKATIRNAGVYEISQTYRPLLAKSAELAAGKAPYDRRIKEALVSLEAIVLWRQGPVAEEDGQLIREDMNNEFTWPRAHQLVVNSRKASAREWGPYRNYHRKFLPWHGGPLIHLKKGDLHVKVAPALAMRIRQIAFKGHVLLREPGPYSKKPEPGYPSVGGAFEMVRNSCPTGLVVGDATGSSVLMEAEGGSGLHFKHYTRKSVTLEGNNTIRIRIQSKQVNRNKSYSQGNASSIAEYIAGKDTQAVKAFAKIGDAWQALTFAVPKPKDAKAKPPPKAVLVAKLPEQCTAFRIHFTDRGIVVEDTIVTPAFRGGSLSWNTAKGLLISRVGPQIATLNTKEFTTTNEHVIRVYADGQLKSTVRNDGAADHAAGEKEGGGDKEEENILNPVIDRKKDEAGQK